MTNQTNLTEMQEDILKEVANIGSGNAATALANILDCQVTISTGSLQIVSISSVGQALGHKGEPSIGIYNLLSGDLSGGSLIFFVQQDAFALTDLMLSKPIGTTTILTEEDRSMLKEVGLVLAAAYLDSLGKLSSLTILPSAPSLVFNRSEEIAALFRQDLEKGKQAADSLICLQTNFAQEEEKIPGTFLIFLEVESWKDLLKALEQ